MFSAEAIAGRVQSLVEKYDGGDAEAAARRLEVSEEALQRLLAGTEDHLDLDVISAVLAVYDADAAWLLTGASTIPTAELPRPVLLRVVRILTGLSWRVYDRWSALRGGRLWTARTAARGHGLSTA